MDRLPTELVEHICSNLNPDTVDAMGVLFKFDMDSVKKEIVINDWLSNTKETRFKFCNLCRTGQLESVKIIVDKFIEIGSNDIECGMFAASAGHNHKVLNWLALKKPMDHKTKITCEAWLKYTA
jgi:hypothetical protein